MNGRIRIWRYGSANLQVNCTKPVVRLAIRRRYVNVTKKIEYHLRFTLGSAKRHETVVSWTRITIFTAEALEESAQIAPKLDALRFERLCEFALLNRSITTYE